MHNTQNCVLGRAFELDYDFDDAVSLCIRKISNGCDFSQSYGASFHEIMHR